MAALQREPVGAANVGEAVAPGFSCQEPPSERAKRMSAARDFTPSFCVMETACEAIVADDTPSS
jgi:hypothetical protein